MFNYAADHTLVLHPRNAGGAVLAFMLSLDSHTADLRFRQASLQQKLQVWYQWQQNKTQDSRSIHSTAHAYGCINFNRELHHECIAQAHPAPRYVHKGHFFELLSDTGPVPLLSQLTGVCRSIGIYLTPRCVERLQQLRPYNESVDWYQMWIYANQRSIMPEYFKVQSLHHFSFSEMLDLDLFQDHVKYCKDLLELDIDMDVCRDVIQQWHRSVLGLGSIDLDNPGQGL